MTIRVQILIFTFFATITGSAFAGIEPQVNAIVRAADLRQTTYSLLAVDITTGQELIAINEHGPMLPASNLKLITSAAALGILGPEYMFKTQLSLLENQSDDATTHALLVTGDGDPAFGDPKLLEQLHDMTAENLLQLWVDAVKATDIKYFKKLIIDDRVFDQQFVHPSWPREQLNNWWCAQVAGINFHDNCLDLLPQPTQPGHAPKVQMTPRSPFIRPSMRAVTGNADTFWASRRIGTNDITYRGKIRNRLSEPVQVTIHDPSIYFGNLLASRLRENGITVDKIIRPKPDANFEPIQHLHLVQTSISQILKRCNKDSQNLFAEALIKRCGRAMTGLPGSWTNGSSVIRFFLHDKLGAQAASVSIADGSGLSRKNQITAKVMVDVLKAMHDDPELWETYRDSLSIAGQDGTLRKRMKTVSAAVHGKSGSIDGVKTLSGYIIFTPENHPKRIVAFSFLFNNIKPPIYGGHIKKVQDDLVKLIDQYMHQVIAIENQTSGATASEVGRVE